MSYVERLLREYIKDNEKFRLMLFQLLEESENNGTLSSLPPDFIHFYIKHLGEYGGKRNE